MSSRGTPHLFWAVGGPSTITGNPAGTPLLLKAYWITFCGNQSNIYPNQQKQNSFLLFEQYFYVSLLKINKFLYQTYGHTERLQFSSLKLLSRMLVCNLKACSNSLICLSEFVFKGSTFALKTVTNEFNIWLSHNLFSNNTALKILVRDSTQPSVINIPTTTQVDLLTFMLFMCLRAVSTSLSSTIDTGPSIFACTTQSPHSFSTLIKFSMWFFQLFLCSFTVTFTTPL